MLFVLIALWLTGALLFVVDPKRSSARWLSGLAFCGGSGAAAAILDDEWIAYAARHGASPTAINLLEHLMMMASLVSYYGVPYTFLLFAIGYHRTYAWMDRVKGWPFWLALPAIAGILTIRPVYPVPIAVLAVWTVPYAAFGAFLVLSRQEALPAMRRNHAFTSLAIVPAVLFVTVMNYILPAVFGMYEYWRYNTWIILFSFVVFLISLFKYGFLGVRFLIERRRLDHTLRSITSGTAILNHAIKNDIGKMRLFCEKMQRYAAETGQTELAQDLHVVSSASQHIQEMIRRIHDKTQEMALRLEQRPLSRAVQETLDGLAPTLAAVEVRTGLRDDPELLYDPAQIAEVLHNVVLNAAEAMNGRGSLEILLYQTKKTAVIEVRDAGPGIDKEKLGRVMDPFYTTKTSGNGMNFGLGLAYGYHVMKKHGGSLELKSEPGRGTNVYLSFPLKGGAGLGRMAGIRARAGG